MKRILFVLILVLASGCSFQVGIGYHGKTGIDDRSVTPEFVTGKHDKDRY